MRYLLMLLSLLLCPVPSAHAVISVGIGTPGLSIGINVPVYPELVPVPGYPVYYAPRLDVNYFFYDGLYWVFVGDQWYESGWYDGPWEVVEPDAVPLFLLRIPVRYYRRPPPYFHGWRADAPPHWGEHWGRDWDQRRGGWQRWQRRSAPPPAPLPSYQRRFSGERYPRELQQQRSIRSEQYHYQPHEPFTQRRFQGNPGGPGGEPQMQRQRNAPHDRRRENGPEGHDQDRR